MNVNHGLLDALGVSTMELSALVYAARNAGRMGKTHRAGGADVWWLCRFTRQVASAIEKPEVRQLFPVLPVTGCYRFELII